jgi:hypothetical protein
MNNSFPRLIDGMCATLRTEVLARLDDEFARGQVFGIINLLNTFKVRADWSAGFLLAQLDAQRVALEEVAVLSRGGMEGLSGERPALPTLPRLPSMPILSIPQATPVVDLLAQRDVGNQAIGAWFVWLDDNRAQLTPDMAGQLEKLLRTAMSAEVGIELKNSPRPLFSEMSSGRED